MPIVISLGLSGEDGVSIPGIATTTAQDIMDCAQKNLKHKMTPSGISSILLDYTNDVQQQILRQRRWQWAKSGVKKFITERGVTDYWLGANNSAPAGTFPTGLALTDIQNVDTESVSNVTDGYVLAHETNTPVYRPWQNADGTFNESPPLTFVNQRTDPYRLQIYPPADTGTLYQIVPTAPVVVTTSGGALTGRTYYVRTSFVDTSGNEGLASNTVRQYVPSGYLLRVKSPVAPIGAGSAGNTYIQYRTYVGTVEGSETRQATTTLGTSWTEAVGGITTNGAAVASTSAIDPLRGYLMSFRYWRKHSNLTAPEDVLLVPDEYADVVCAGVSWMGAQWLGDWERVPFWDRLYQQGLTRMIANETPFESTPYIAPDGAWA